MSGSGSYGEQPYGGDLPGWRAIVESDGSLAQSSADAPAGGSTAQGVAAMDGHDATAPGGAAVSPASSSLTGADAISAPGAGVVESSTNASQAGDLAAPGAGVVESATAATGASAISTTAVTIFAAMTDATGASTESLVSSPIALGSTDMTGSIETLSDVTSSESPPLQKHYPPQLLPIYFSHADDDLQAELKDMFMYLFETHVRPDERRVNALGIPHLGPRGLVEQSLASDGLSIYRGASVARNSGAYLLRSWRAMNPKRGTHLLETYLQLLWPNVWKAAQMWQEKGEDYPEVLTEADEGNHFMTSRINVSLPSRTTTGGDVSAISQGLRASLPARMVLELSITSEEQFDIGIANAFYVGLVAQHYEGTFT